jgi:hypothetical protein
MTDKVGPGWEPGNSQPRQGELHNNNSGETNLNANQRQATSRQQQRDPIRERVNRQLTASQAALRPRLLMRGAVRTRSELARVEHNCQVFANKFREACVICGPRGKVLAFCEPK